MTGKTIVYAHRGASSVAPENTMMAFKKAIDMGCHGIECDVQLTKDGELIICHDERLERTTNGKGFIKDFTFKELQKLDAGNGEQMPHLNDLLALIKQSNKLINIEIKSGIIIYPHIEERVVAAVKAFGLQDKTVISSFNHYSIKLVRQIDQSIKTGILYMEGLYEPWAYMKTVDCQCAHPFVYAIKPDIASGILQHGYDINVFTVDDPNMAKQLSSMGVTGIITNYPDRILKALQERN